MVPAFDEVRDNAAMLAAEGFEVGGGINVSDRGDFLFGIEHFIELAPTAFNFAKLAMSAIEQPAAGRKNGDLVRGGHDVGDFGHKMHAQKIRIWNQFVRLGGKFRQSPVGSAC